MSTTTMNMESRNFGNELINEIREKMDVQLGELYEVGHMHGYDEITLKIGRVLYNPLLRGREIEAVWCVLENPELSSSEVVEKLLNDPNKDWAIDFEIFRRRTQSVFG